MGKKKISRDSYRASLETNEQAGAIHLPRKAFYRQRAHTNPFADHALNYPINPESMDWSDLYPAVDFKSTGKHIDVLDIGCGFGGLLFALGPQLPDMLLLGLEIRISVAEFVREKVKAVRLQSISRQQQSSTSSTLLTTTEASKGDSATITLPTDVNYTFDNISCLRANAMKHLPNFFAAGSLSKLFFCFPDPHFKQKKHKARIVSRTLVAEYAYVLKPGGIVYTITDVEDLHRWMMSHFDSCPLFERLGDEELKEDVCVDIMSKETEEGKKVERNGGMKWIACWRRRDDPGWDDEDDDV